MAGAFLFPLFLIISYGFSSSGAISIFSPLNLHVIRFTLYEALLSTLLAFGIGLPGAFLLARKTFRFKTAFSALSTVPFVMPSVSMALGFYTFYASNGILNEYFLWPLFHVRFTPLFSLEGVVMGNAFYNFPLVMIMIAGALSSVEKSRIEAALVDGADRVKTFLYIELPSIFPAVLGAFLLVFIYSFTSFAVVLMIGGARYATVEVQIYMYLRTLLDFKNASALTLFQLFFIFTVGFVFSKIQGNVGALNGNFSRSKEKMPVWGYAYIALLSVFAFGPMISQIFAGFWDFQSSRFTLKWFFDLFSGSLSMYTGNSVFDAILWTFVFSFSSSVVVVALSMSAGRYCALRNSSFLSSLFTSPLSVSAVTLAFGYVLLQSRFFIPFPLEITLVYCVISFPIAFQIFLSAWRSFPYFLEEAADIDGASWLTKFFGIDVPLMKPQIISAFLFSFAIAMGEMGATVVLYNPRYATVSVSAYRLFSSRHVPQAQALGALLTISTFLIFYALERPFLNEK